MFEDDIQLIREGLEVLDKIRQAMIEDLENGDYEKVHQTTHDLNHNSWLLHQLVINLQYKIIASN